MLREIGDYRGVGIVTPCGNEANTSRHYRSEMLAPGGETEVEIRVGSQLNILAHLYQSGNTV